MVGRTAEEVDTEKRLAQLRTHTAFRSPWGEWPRTSSEEVWSTGSPEMDDALGGGLPKGKLVEIVGERSSGRTSFIWGGVAAATQREEYVTWIDVNDALDPQSAQRAGVVLSRLLWLRLDEHRWEEQTFRAAEEIIRGGGFQVVVLDAVGRRRLRHNASRWFRLKRALRGTSLVCLVLSDARQGIGADLRLRCRWVRGARDSYAVEILRQRGGAAGRVVLLS